MTPTRSADPVTHLAGRDDKPAADVRPTPDGPAPTRRGDVWRRMRRSRGMYLFIVPGMLWFGVFAYLPMAGNIIAFQDYSPYRGISESPLVGLTNFAELFGDREFLVSLRNTLYLSVLQIVFAFPAPIALALLLNSLLSERLKRLVQTVVYLPHFLGWVIVISIWQQVLSAQGPVNQVRELFGAAPENLMANPDHFGLLITAQVIWKEVGWGTIIFLAAAVGVPAERYEAAAIDGAGAWRRMWHVTLPGMLSIIVLMFVLRMGTVLTVGFEQLILQQGAVGADAAQVLDTFAYYRGVLGGDWGLAAAAGLFKGLIGTALVLLFNRLAKRVTGAGVF